MNTRRNIVQTSNVQRTGDSSVTVYRHLFDAILEQRLQPGSRLAEDKLGGIFGVSRTVIRTALQRLAGEGVVVMRPNRGAAVATPGVDEARQVLDARRIVELAVVERLCGAGKSPGGEGPHGTTPRSRPV